MVSWSDDIGDIFIYGVCATIGVGAHKREYGLLSDIECRSVALKAYACQHGWYDFDTSGSCGCIACCITDGVGDSIGIDCSRIYCTIYLYGDIPISIIYRCGSWFLISCILFQRHCCITPECDDGCCGICWYHDRDYPGDSISRIACCITDGVGDSIGACYSRIDCGAGMNMHADIAILVIHGCGPCIGVGVSHGECDSGISTQCDDWRCVVCCATTCGIVLASRAGIAVGTVVLASCHSGCFGRQDDDAQLCLFGDVAFVACLQCKDEHLFLRDSGCQEAQGLALRV